MYLYGWFLDILNWLWTCIYRTMALHIHNSGAASSGLLKYVNRMMELRESIYWEIWIESLIVTFCFIEILNWTMEKFRLAKNVRLVGDAVIFGPMKIYRVITVTVTWTLWHLRSPIIWLLDQQFVRANGTLTSEFTLRALYEANPLVTNGFLIQRASNSENVSYDDVTLTIKEIQKRWSVVLNNKWRNGVFVKITRFL